MTYSKFGHFLHFYSYLHNARNNGDQVYCGEHRSIEYLFSRCDQISQERHTMKANTGKSRVYLLKIVQK